jgi:DNA repair protein SbcD/Mre11
MRIGALADCHLGYRQTQRCNEAGQNIRELDVAAAFLAAIDGVLAAKPDMVAICGDVFNTPRPPNGAITFLYRQLARLRQAGVPVVLISGNHDSPRTSDTGSILHLYREIGIEVATSQTTTFLYPELDCRVVAVPWPALADGIPEPEGSEQNRILVVHGPAEGMYPGQGASIPREVLASEEWSAILCGDWHGFKQVGPRAYYSGSLEYCSSDIWSEIATPKSWSLVDTDTGEVTPQPVPTRQVVDCEALDATNLTAEEINAHLSERFGDVTGKILRIKVLNVPRQVQRALDWKAIRRWQADALHLRLDFRRPEWMAAAARPFQRKQSLAEIVAEFLGRRELPAGMDREAFTKLGTSIMAETEEAESHKVEQRGAA